MKQWYGRKNIYPCTTLSSWSISMLTCWNWASVRPAKSFCKRLKLRAHLDQIQFSLDTFKRFHSQQIYHSRNFSCFWVCQSLKVWSTFSSALHLMHIQPAGLPTLFRGLVDCMNWVKAKSAGSLPFRALILSSSWTFGTQALFSDYLFRRLERNWFFYSFQISTVSHQNMLFGCECLWKALSAWKTFFSLMGSSNTG